MSADDTTYMTISNQETSSFIIMLSFSVNVLPKEVQLQDHVLVGKNWA